MSPARKKKAAGPTAVESTQHADTRVNIPTGELADFVADAEKQPTSVLYPRDPTLDPQLVWKGKDEQDLAEYLEVAAVPVYIQEKVDPRALVENLRQTADADTEEPELTLFDDFDGLEFDQLVDFYAHEGNWSNRLILGDALLVMNSLAEKESLRGKVQMIYVDPPYGIKFGSNWQVSTRKREVSDGKDVDVTRQPEQIKAFRDTWELGIHSYLSYLRDRLTVARELLTESLVRASSRSATRTSTASGHSWMRSSAKRTSSASSQSRRRRRQVALASARRCYQRSRTTWSGTAEIDPGSNIDRSSTLARASTGSTMTSCSNPTVTLDGSPRRRRPDRPRWPRVNAYTDVRL